MLAARGPGSYCLRDVIASTHTSDVLSCTVSVIYVNNSVLLRLMSRTDRTSLVETTHILT